MKRIVYICLIFSEQRIRHSHYQNLLKLCSTTSPFPCLPRLALCLCLLGVFMFALRKLNVLMPTVTFVVLLHAAAHVCVFHHPIVLTLALVRSNFATRV